MSMDDIYKMPGHLFRRMQQIAVATFMEECADFDLTPVQFGALVAIRENPGIDATRVSALIAFDRSTIGNVLERLETKGLIARSGSKNDKRIKVLTLTHQGRKALDGITPLVNRAQTRMLEPLALAERKQLMRLLHKLIDLNHVTSRPSAASKMTTPGAANGHSRFQPATGAE